MVPIGPNSEGVMTFRMTGMFAEVFDNLQVTLLFIHIGSQKIPSCIIDNHFIKRFLSIQLTKNKLHKNVRTLSKHIITENIIIFGRVS